jgi:hypothetical protein
MIMRLMILVYIQLHLVPFLSTKEFAFNSMLYIDKYTFYLDTLANIHFTPYKDLLVDIIDHDTSISTVSGSTMCKHIGIFPVIGNEHLYI